jgi:alpha-L-rhamnosidase
VDLPDRRVTAPTRLLVEHLTNPLGTSVRAPRLSWWLPEGATVQHAFRLTTDGWDSGRVASPQHHLVPFGGPAAGSRERVEWRVKVWTDLGESEWSEPSWWEVGLLDPADWTARWITPVEPVRPPAGERPGYELRAELDVPTGVRRARAYATAHGVYELLVDGARVGDVELAPGATAYRTNLDVQTYDVTGALAAGTHEIRAVLTDGWWRGKTGIHREADCFGDELALLVQLEIDLDDGRRITWGTGPGWTTAAGPILRADLMDGEAVDLRRRAGEWVPAPVVDLGYDHLSASPAPPVRRVEEISPVAVTELAPGRHVIDLGQNITGRLRLTNLGPAGTELTIEHGEMLDETGDVTQDHLTPVVFGTDERLSPGQVDAVVSTGEAGAAFEPRHTVHGFRYARVEGHPGPFTTADATGVVVHTDMRRTGWFRCSDDRIDRLHEAAVWSFRDNACDIPTDCPHRERLGWTGDWQLFIPTATFLYDVAGFSAKWLRDLRADQWPDGRVPNVLPFAPGPEGQSDPIQQHLTGSAGWGDAAVIVPWEMWLAYGDERVLDAQYASMQAWVGFIEERARTGRHATRMASRPEAAPHERYLWDTGFHWGEWCEPDGTPMEVFTLEQDVGDVATAYFHRSADLLARIAAVLGREDDARRYRALADHVRAAWQAEFIDADGHLHPDTQASHVRALAFDLVPEDRRADTGARLVELIRERDTHLSTGFLATPFLLPVLADHGYLDVAYELLFQDTPPSWLAMIDAGATTIWENWDASASLNHYSKGAVVTFLHRYVAGLRPDPETPCLERFTVAPRPGGGITEAEATYDSPRGRARSSWTMADGRFALDVEVPPGATATVVLPDGTQTTAAPGRSSYACPVS